MYFIFRNLNPTHVYSNALSFQPHLLKIGPVKGRTLRLTEKNKAIASVELATQRLIIFSESSTIDFWLSYECTSGPDHILINDAHRENCVLVNSVQEFIEIKAWLLLTFFICLHNQILSILLAHIKQNRCLGKMTKHERLLLSACFTPKFELVFVLIEENASS